MKLSGLIVAHNEESHLPDCLASLSFCDEIMVVLDKCTDRSKEIALEAGARILEGSWELEGPRRNEGISACEGEWILELDADERVPTDLAKEIREVVNTSSYDFHLIPFDNYIGKDRVRYGWGAYFGASQKSCLFRKGHKFWGSQRVHPKLELSKNVGPRLENRILHYVDNDISDMLNRLDRYTTLNAIDLRSGETKQKTFGKYIRQIFSRFYKCYVLRKGYKEGKYGFLVALCAGLYPILSYLKATLEEGQQDHGAN